MADKRNKFRLIRLGQWLVLPLLLLGLPIAEAATGASIPTYTDPFLNIPRIDVEGYGALDVTLALVDANTQIFALISRKTAAATATPGATFDRKSGIIDVPLFRNGTTLYSAQFRHIDTNRFQATTVAIAAGLPGQSSYQQMCAGCHGADGLGGTSKVTMHNCAWCGSLSMLSTYIDRNMPQGNPSLCNATCAGNIAAYITTAFNASSGSQVEKALDALSLESDDATLRKAALMLVGRLPVAAEIVQVRTTEGGLHSVVGKMMDEPAFYDRLSEIFNDWLLTNRYMSTNGSEAAIGLMGGFANARWYDTGVRDAAFTLNRETTNNSVAAEPLELINYVAKNDLPASEILTADYMMVNGYSAKSYGITDVVFEDEWDPREFKPAKLPGIPHAGLLTSLMFLNRFPTTATNRNRARARVVYDLFLDVDILGFDGVRPNGSAVDITSTTPTMDNPDCVKCHSLLDPVASTFQDWNNRGKYALTRSWYRDMFQSGFGGKTPPEAYKGKHVQWLAAQIAADPRFDGALVRLLYKGLTRREPLPAPGAGATAAEIEAYQAEAEVLGDIKEAYIADGRKLKTLVREIVLSPYWRAAGLDDTAFAQVHAETGAAQLLTPELLHRKIGALLGFEWRGPLDQYSTAIKSSSTARLLNGRTYYQQLYGGIDSFSVTERLGDPNGLMAKVQERMANELACYAVPDDFLSAKAQRRLFPLVETTTTLGDAQNQSAVRANIQHLHRYLLGEQLALDSPEIAETYALFSAVLQDGKNRIGTGETTALPSRCVRTKDLLTGATLSGGGLRTDPNYTIRAWMAVVAYLLTDYRFLYE